MQPLKILLLSDGRPGHYHLAEGVAASIARRRPVDVQRMDIRLRRWLPAPTRTLTAMLRHAMAPERILRIGYGLAAGDLPPADLVVSAGGDTLVANAAAARRLGTRNIFCGTLRRMPPEAVSLVVSSYARHAALPRHLVTLKPSGIDPDSIGRERLKLEPGEAPRVIGVLIGGDGGRFRYEAEDWRRLIGFLEAMTNAHETRWIISTSPRSPQSVADALAALAQRPHSRIDTFIDYRTSGPGTIKRVFAAADAILCTEDSSTMMSEAVCARLPVVGVSPRRAGFSDDEREYREFMRGRGWCRFVPLSALTPQSFMAALADVHPLRDNHLDLLADALSERLPDLFAEDMVS
jgi:mitochondrial fission protein ELM1